MQSFNPAIGSIRIKKYKDTFVSARVIFAYIVFIISQQVSVSGILAVDEPLEYVRLYLDGNLQMWIDAEDSLEI